MPTNFRQQQQAGFMPEEDRVEHTFAQSGMGPQPEVGSPEATVPSPRVEPHEPGRGAKTPQQFTQAIEGMPTPEALEGSTDPMSQFLYGVTSPVRDTLSGLGMVDPRPMPDDWRGTAANIAGSIVGWVTAGALATAAAPATMTAVGAKAAGATAKAGGKLASSASGLGVGLSREAGTTIVRGAVSGGLSEAHWAWGQKDEPVGTGFLRGVAFGTALGGAGAGIQRFARQKPTTGRTLRKMQEDKNMDILSVTDQDTLSRAYGKRISPFLTTRAKTELDSAMQQVGERARQAEHPLPSSVEFDDVGVRIGGEEFWNQSQEMQVEQLVDTFMSHPERQSILEPVYRLKAANTAVKDLNTMVGGEAGRRIKRYTKAAAPIQRQAQFDDNVISKDLRSLWDKHLPEFDNATNLGEQERAFKKIRDTLNRRKSKIMQKYEEEALTPRQKRSTIRNMTERDITEYRQIDEALQDLQWELGNRTVRVLRDTPDDLLPPLGAIEDPVLRKDVEKTLGRMAQEGDDLWSNVQWHSELQEIIETAKREMPHRDITNTTFLPRRYRDMWDAKKRELVDRGESTRIFSHPLADFEVPEHVTSGEDLTEFMQQLDQLPEGAIRAPISAADAYTLTETDIPAVLGRALSPVRYVLGHSPANKLRHTTNTHRKFVDKWMHPVRQMMEENNLTTPAQKRAWGQTLGKVIERDMAGTEINDDVMRALRTIRDSDVADAETIRRASREVGLKPETVQKAYDNYLSITQDSHKMDALTKAGRRFGREADEISDSVLADNIYNEKLRAADFLGGKALASQAAKFGVEPQQLKMASKGSKLLDDLFVEAGLDPSQYRTAYLPHFREMDGLSRSQIEKYFKGLGLSSDQIDGYMWVNELGRQGTMMEYDQDFFAIMGRYISGLSKKKHMEPVFQELDALYSTDLPTADRRRQVYEDIKEWMVGRPSSWEMETDKAIRNFMGNLNRQDWVGPKPTREMSAMFAELQYTAGMGFNPWMPVRNLTQKALALSSITDDGNWLRGLQYMMRANLMKNKRHPEHGKAMSLMPFNKIRQERQFAEGLNHQASAISEFASRTGAPGIADKWQRFRDRGFQMFRWSDRSNVEDTFLARALYLTEEKQAPLADAVELANATTMATQFMYGFDSPMLYKSALGRQIGVFQSWPINWAHMLWEQGTSGSMQRAVQTIGIMAVASEALSLTGMNFRSISPTETVRGMLPLQMLEGEQNWPIALRTFSTTTDALRGLAAGDDAAIQAAMDDYTSLTASLVPAGLVGERTLSFVDRVRHDWKQFEDPGPLALRGVMPTREDTARQEHEVSPQEAIRGLLGPTVETRQRREDWAKGAQMHREYRDLRRQAVEAFLDGDLGRFEQYQEQLVTNFGAWIEPQDIQQEYELQEMTARERQMMGMPGSIRDPFLQEIQEEGRLRDDWQP